MKQTTEADRPSPRALAGLLGISRRAGRLTTGFDAVSALIKGGNATLVMLAADLSAKTVKELRFAARGQPATIVRLPLTKEEAGTACGLKKPVGVLATDDKGFAAAMEKHCTHDTEEEPAI